MSKYPFNESEMTVRYERPGMFPGAPGVQEFTFPVSQKEAVISLYRREPVWQITQSEINYFAPDILPDNVARASVMAAGGTMAPTDGADMFGVEWEYVPAVGGCMVRPGKPMLTDANDWERVIKFPDIGKYDWQKAKDDNKEYLSQDRFNFSIVLNGFFERLISFMEFENAAFALADEDQQDAVKALMDKLADFYIELFDKELEVFPQIDGFFIHDDWGSQRAPFFSPQVAREFIVPAMKRVTDYIHSRGRFAELHSCGLLEMQIPNIIKAGWDSWSPQLINDTHKYHELYGDKLIIGVSPDLPGASSNPFEPKTPERQTAEAEAYAAAFCKPDKPSVMNQYSGMMLAPEYRAALYRASRIGYCG